MFPENPEMLVERYIADSMEVQRLLASRHSARIAGVAEKMASVLDAGGKIYLCGNGGSAADAQHVAAEMVGRFLRKRRALPAVALTTDTSVLLALGNDYGFEEIFARQVEALVGKSDILVGISTSGRSENVLRAVRKAKEIGAFTIGFTGEPGEPLVSTVDLALAIPCSRTPHIQESQLLCWHLVCDLVERSFVSEP